MSKLKIEDIRELLAQKNWELISTEYNNLDTDLHYKCPEGHDVYGPLKRFRKKDGFSPSCPICANNKYQDIDIKPTLKPSGACRILVFDQASHVSGWAVYDDMKLVKYGSFEVKGGEEIERCHKVKMIMLSMIEGWKPDYVGLEDIQFQDTGGGHTMGVTVYQTLAHLQGILMEACFERSVPFQLCNTNTWRHEVGVKGRSRADKKKSMQMKVKQWYDVTVTDDCADAIGIGYYLSHKLNKNLEVQNWE